MPLYSKSPKESLMERIRESNPNLPLTLIADGVTFGKPKTIALTPGSAVDTEIVMSARGPSGYVKKTTVKYRRLSLDTLFRGQAAEVHKYSARGPLEYPFDMFGLLNEVNALFGLNLTEEDVVNTWFPWQSDKYYPDLRTCQAALVAKPDSLLWVGQATIRWVSDRQSLADMILKQELPGRVYPGVVKNGPSKYVLSCATYDADFGEFTDVLDSQWATGTPFGIDNGLIRPVHDAMLAAINEVSGQTYTYDAPPEPFGLGGIVPQRYTLPHPAVPEANSRDFNRVIVLPYPASETWGAGNLLLHYSA